MELRIFEFSLYGTAVSYPAGDFHRRPEEMLPVVSDVGEDSPEAPHISRGGDVRVISLQNLRSQVTDSAAYLRGAVVHGGGGPAWYQRSI